jgi:type II secretory pathway pseudopilin PulG
MKHLRAFTLVEILVAASLLLLVIGMIGLVLQPSLKIATRETVRSDLLTQGQLSLGTMAKDLAQTPVEGVVFHSPDPAQVYLSVHATEEFGPDGQLIFGERTNVYYRNGPTLVVHESEEVPKDAPFRPTLADWPRLVSGPVKRTFSSHVDSFRISDANPATPAIELPLKFQLTLKKAVGPNAEETVEFERSIYLNNG